MESHGPANRCLPNCTACSTAARVLPCRHVLRGACAWPTVSPWQPRAVHQRVALWLRRRPRILRMNKKKLAECRKEGKMVWVYARWKRTRRRVAAVTLIEDWFAKHVQRREEEMQAMASAAAQEASDEEEESPPAATATAAL